MQSTRHDTTLAALQAGAGLPGHVLDVVVLSADPGLFATLREASGPEHALWHAPSADTAVDLLVGGRCCILIADLGTLRGDAAALLDRLHAQFPELILMATGRREEEHAVATLVSDGLIYRFLHKPISPARANLFLATATRRYNEMRSSEQIALTTVKTIAARPNVTKIIAAIVALLIVVIGVVIWRSLDKPSAAQPPPRAVGTLTNEEQIADYLARAQMAIVTDRLLEPRGNNALEYLRAVLAIQPDNADARAGIERVGAALEMRVVEALQARNPVRGATALAALQHAQPEHPRLDGWRTELLALSRSRPAQPISSAPPPAARPTKLPAAKLQTKPAASAEREQPRPPGDVASRRGAPGPSPDELNEVARLRSRGVLIEPARNNAYEQLLALRERYPDSSEVRTEQQQLAFAMLERTRTALAAGDGDGAAAFLSRVELLLPNMTATKSLQAQLASAQQQRDFASNVVAAAALKRVREVPPSYPRDAERQGIEGWVEVEFTIAPDGTTQSLIVREAQPAGAFDKAAVDSVSKWRFAPILKNDAPIAQRASVRVRFKLRD